MSIVKENFYRKCYKVYPKITIDGLTRDQAITIKIGMDKLIAINEGMNHVFYYSCYTVKHYNSDKWTAVLMMNEAYNETINNKTIADSYIKTREWMYKLEKIANELMDTAGVTS